MQASSNLKVERTRNIVERLAQTRKKYARAGRPWVVPTSIANAYRMLSPMIVRYAKGDNRHEDTEAFAEEEFALWLANQHRELSGAPLLKEATWTSPWLPSRHKKSLLS